MSDDEKDKGRGKSPTKFMERPGTGKKKEEEEQDQSHPEFINDDMDALESQEKQDEDQQDQGKKDENQDSTLNEGWKKPARKDEKPDPRKFQEPEKTDSSSDDKGDCACP